MNRFLIVCFTKPGFPAEFPDADWPPHVTALRSFTSDAPKDELAAVLRSACDKHTPFEAHGKARERFGPTNEVWVTELWCPLELSCLRAELMAGYDGKVSYVGVGYPTYRPHVTDQRGESLPVDGKVEIVSASLIEKVGERRVVIGTFPLGGE